MTNKRMVLTKADIERMSPAAQAQIAEQLTPKAKEMYVSYRNATTPIQPVPARVIQTKRRRIPAGLTLYGPLLLVMAIMAYLLYVS
jgi:hypothetical protein